MNKYTALSAQELKDLHSKGIIKQDPDVIRINKAGKEFVSIYFRSSDPTDIKLTVRNVTAGLTADGRPNWGTAGSGKQLLQKAGGAVKMGTRCAETVEAYEIDGKTITTYSLVLFEGENKATMFRRAGHPLVGTAVAESAPVEAPAGQELGNE